jgi:hypothetical protein
MANTILLSLALAVLGSAPACSQMLMSHDNLLILNNGKSHEFKRWKLTDEEVRIVLSTGQKLVVPLQAVDGYYDKHNQIMYHKKPLKFRTAWEASDLDYDFMYMFLDGKIRLYQSVRQELGAGNTITEYFIEKDEKFEAIYGAESSRKEERELLESLVADDPHIHERAISEDFRFNLDNVIELANEYNVRSFREVETRDDLNIGSVMFYLRLSRKLDAAPSLIVNDSEEYELFEGKPITVRLPVESASKVCFLSGSGKMCTIMRAHQFGLQYWELTVNAEGSLKMRKESAKEALYHINYLRSQTR